MRLDEIMTSPVLTITAELSVADAASKMREHDVGSLVVVRRGIVEGIITSWDVGVGCVGSGDDPAISPILLYMSSPVHTARPDTDVMEAARVMAERKISRLPIVDDEGRPLGIATFSNISRVMQQLASDLLTGWDRIPATSTSAPASTTRIME